MATIKQISLLTGVLFMYCQKPVQKQVDRCSRILRLDGAVVDTLKSPLLEFHVSLPVRMDNRTAKVFQCYRVHHIDAVCPARGGIHFHPEETADPV